MRRFRETQLVIASLDVLAAPSWGERQAKIGDFFVL
jgi:hypothetical protein